MLRVLALGYPDKLSILDPPDRGVQNIIVIIFRAVHHHAGLADIPLLIRFDLCEDNELSCV